VTGVRVQTMANWGYNRAMETVINVVVYGQFGALGAAMVVLFSMMGRDLWDLARGKA
jgi:hypothetical protein